MNRRRLRCGLILRILAVKVGTRARTHCTGFQPQGNQCENQLLDTSAIAGHGVLDTRPTAKLLTFPDAPPNLSNYLLPLAGLRLFGRML
jgi:hypothetical protein